ncbi:ComEA family DNA-binding protein [Paenibacillus sp. NEAU-GSW1]|uniref:ComEA family DNA-binding protein n=1 Tax=Paenibacillus sp. NEAU-GSW1 TaxID=2682486 RepID=UPI00156761D7|nr:ComEA family DNA-binding protein [Paenibacillus sp. NEAU-GSW1]
MKFKARKAQYIESIGKITVVVLLIAAAGLLAAAFAWPKKEAPLGWEPLNRQVEAALLLESAHDAGNGDKAAASSKGESEADNRKEASKAAAPESSSKASESNGAAEMLDINRATSEQLDRLKGIGPSKAKAIVADRELNGFFQSTDDLLRVKGIGPKLLAALKESIVARP